MSILSTEAIKKLQQEYMRAFPEKWKLLTDSYDKENWQTIIDELHKFAGSGTTYKMPEITRAAKVIELYLERHSPPDLQLVWEGLELFRQVLVARQTGQEPIDVFNHEVLKKLEA